jgi:predicted site-specific integrase-resolvase
MADHELLTLVEMADRLRIPVATARYWRSIGQGPRSARMGRKVVYRREDVDRYIAETFEGAAVTR